MSKQPSRIGPGGATTGDIECPLKSIGVAIAFTPHDWATHHRMAWIYGIACGWDAESMAELTAQFQWTPATVARLERLRAKWVAMEGKA